MKRTKKTIAIMLLVVCIFTLIPAYPCYASNDNVIMPRWNNVSNVYTSLLFDGNIGEASASVGKGSTVTSMSGTITIYEYQAGAWIVIDSISKTTTRNTLAMMLEFDGTSGVEYKMELVVRAYNGASVIEEITDIKYARCS